MTIASTVSTDFEGVSLKIDDVTTDLLEDFRALVTTGRDFLVTHELQNQSPSGIFFRPRSSRKCSESHLYEIECKMKMTKK